MNLIAMKEKGMISQILLYQDNLHLPSIVWLSLPLPPMTVLMILNPNSFYNSLFQDYISLETPTDRSSTILFQFL
jgi:hypothetical protein